LLFLLFNIVLLRHLSQMAQHSPPASIGSAGSPYANRAVPAHNPRIVGPMPAHTPRTAGPMPRQTELLDLIEDYQEGGVWGIGLNLELSPPHHVLHVDNLVCITVCALAKTWCVT
jgi:hypothetical protein